jgi:sugar lactone lactonase YvrE
MLSSLNCPNCQASLNYQSNQQQATIHCDFCNSTIVVPESLRTTNQPPKDHQSQQAIWQNVTQLAHSGQNIEAIKMLHSSIPMDLASAKEIVDAIARHEGVFLGGSGVQITTMGEPVTLSPEESRRVSRWVGCFVLFIVLIIAVSAIIPLMGTGIAVWLGFESATESNSTELNIPTIVTVSAGIIEPTTTPPPTPGFADVVLTVGNGEGTGPGFFNDTRWIGLDGGGNIYTADYGEGRVQIFDASGKFLQMWNAGDIYITSMTVDREGTFYALTARNVLRFSGKDGTPLPNFLLPDGMEAEALATAPDGSIIVFSPERILRLSPNGDILLDVPGVKAVDPDYYAPNPAIASNGSGEMYVLGDESIYKFAADGRFVNQFGSRGQADDQFLSSPNALVVDGAGRVFVSASTRILVFDGTGRYLAEIPLDGVTFDMVLTDENELLVMDRNNNRFLKFHFN